MDNPFLSSTTRTQGTDGLTPSINIFFEGYNYSRKK